MSRMRTRSSKEFNAAAEEEKKEETAVEPKTKRRGRGSTPAKSMDQEETAKNEKPTAEEEKEEAAVEPKKRKGKGTTPAKPIDQEEVAKNEKPNSEEKPTAEEEKKEEAAVEPKTKRKNKDTTPAKSMDQEEAAKNEKPISEEQPTKSDKQVVKKDQDKALKPVYTMEDVERAQQFFMEGKRNFVCGSIAEASDSLARASQVFAGYYGEDARECVDVYYFYGRSLLDLSRKEPDVVSGAVEGTCLANIDAESGGEEDNGAAETAPLVDTESGEPDVTMTPEEVREKVLDAIDENAVELEKEAAKKAAAAAGETSGEALASGDAPMITGETTTKKEGADDEAMQEETSADEEMEEDTTEGEESADENKENKPIAEEETLDEISNLQLSWEMLDMARVILEKYSDKASQERLADVRLALGEQAMEDEQFEKAIGEFVAALDIQMTLLPEDDRGIALSHYNIGVARNLKEEYEKAVEAFEHAVRVLKMRLTNMQKKLAEFKEGGDEKEKTELEADIKDLEALIVDVETRIQDCIESRAQMDAAKQAMDEETKNKTAEDAGGSGGADKEEKVTDVSHLVRKSVKRASGGDTEMDEPTKKAKMEEETVNGTNGHGDKMETKEAATE